MWRNTALPVRLLILDARACFPLLAFIVYWSWTTFWIAVTGMAFFTVISWFGLTVPAVLRLVRRLIVGPIRPAVPVWKRRRLA
jgi:intracellular multiplication protein IcmT